MDRLVSERAPFHSLTLLTRSYSIQNSKAQPRKKLLLPTTSSLNACAVVQAARSLVG